MFFKYSKIIQIQIRNKYEKEHTQKAENQQKQTKRKLLLKYIDFAP